MDLPPLPPSPPPPCPRPTDHDAVRPLATRVVELEQRLAEAEAAQRFVLLHWEDDLRYFHEPYHYIPRRLITPEQLQVFYANDGIIHLHNARNQWIAFVEPILKLPGVLSTQHMTDTPFARMFHVKTSVARRW
jgi:hypothetical protein